MQTAIEVKMIVQKMCIMLIRHKLELVKPFYAFIISYREINMPKRGIVDLMELIS